MLYKGQTLLTVELDTGVDISTASTKEIVVTKPDGTKEAVAATVTGTTKLTYVVPSGSTLFNQEGVYKLQGRFIISAREAWTEIIERIFYNPL